MTRLGAANRPFSMAPAGWIGPPQWIYRAKTASAGNERGAFFAGVIFTIPLHGIGTLIRNGGPSGVTGLIGMARAYVKAQRDRQGCECKRYLYDGISPRSLNSVSF